MTPAPQATTLAPPSSRPAACDVALPFVTVVMPVRDEARHLARSLGAVLRQDWPRDRLEVVVAVAPSRDGTAALARSTPGVRVLDNPGGSAASGLNAAIAVARGDVIVRIDGHTEVPPDFVRRSVAALLASGADVAGGVIETRAPGDSGAAGRAVAVAMSSRFGAGSAAFRTGTAAACDADTVAFPAYRRDVFDRLGGFDEAFARNQDDEFHLRVVRAGGRIRLDPAIRATYFARPTPAAAARQYFGYGFHKARLLRRHGTLPTPRALAPAALVASLLASAAFSATTGDARALAVVCGAYLLPSFVASLAAARRADPGALVWLPVAYAALHLGYGAGFLAGLPAALVRPPVPRIPAARDPERAERHRLRAAYARRDADPAARARDDDAGTAWLVTDRELRLRALLADEGLSPLPHRPWADLGCGRGTSMALLPSLGASGPGVGVDALPGRMGSARGVAADLARLPFGDGTLAAALLATALGSISDPDVRRLAAREAVRVLRPGGVLLVYELRLRGRTGLAVPPDALRRLFPRCRVAFHSAGLLPPVARAAARISPRLCGFLAALPFLRSHVVAVVRRATDLTDDDVRRGDAARRVADVALAAPLLVVAAPLIAVLALLVRATSRGPAFHRAIRVGRGGRTFVMPKLRTMVVGNSGPAVTAAADPRVTRLGAVLRRMHLDELPQLWSVVRGDMSLVGPRPESPEFVDAGDPRWRLVLATRPGLTGPVQLAFGPREARGLRGADAESVYRRRLLPRKLAADVSYLARRSVWTDLGWIARTLLP